MKSVSVANIPEQMPRTNNHFVCRIGQYYLKLTGWKVSGELPESSKMIMAVAPHTSNWDFCVGIMVKSALRLKLNFLGKHSLFIGPFGKWLKYVGGIPIDRSAAHGVVGQLVTQFQQRESLVLAIAPEGTRSKVKQWKTGFLHIAKQAQVPLVLVQIDYSTKHVIFYPKRMVTGDIEQELVSVQSVFDKKCAKYPSKF